MTKRSYEILRMKDKFQSLKIKVPTIFDLPSRLLIVGKSELSGKSNLIANLILREKCYRKYFNPENIIIVCQSSSLDDKWKTMITELDIPDMNIIKRFNETKLEALYDLVKEEYIKATEENKKPNHWLFIFDDVSYDGSLKSSTHGIVSKLFCNGRHLLISTWITSQKYTDIPMIARENSTGLILFSCTNKQIESIYEEHSLLNRKEFFKLYHDTTDEPYTFIVINYSNSKKERYMNSNFEPIDIDKYKKNK